MGGNLNLAEVAAVEVLNKAGPADEFFLVEFNSTARLVAPLTRNPNNITRGMPQSVPKGATALFDAIHFSLQEIGRAENNRRALVVFTDGLDSSSSYTSAASSASSVKTPW